MAEQGCQAGAEIHHGAHQRMAFPDVWETNIGRHILSPVWASVSPHVASPWDLMRTLGTQSVRDIPNAMRTLAQLERRKCEPPLLPPGGSETPGTRRIGLRNGLGRAWALSPG